MHECLHIDAEIFKCALSNCCCCYCEYCLIEYPTCHNRITSCTPMSNCGGAYSPLPSVLNQATLALNMAAIELGSSCQLSFWAASVKKKPSTSEWSKIWLYPWILASHSSHIKCWCVWVLLPQHSKGQPSTLRRFCFRLGVVKNVWTVLSLSFNGNSDAEVASKLPARDRERAGRRAASVCFVFALVCGYLGSEISLQTHTDTQMYVHSVAMCGLGEVHLPL